MIEGYTPTKWKIGTKKISSQLSLGFFVDGDISKVASELRKSAGSGMFANAAVGP